MRHVAMALACAAGFAGANAQAAGTVGGCQLLPDDNPWNTRIDAAAVDPQSDAYIANINAHGGGFVHPDFGSNPLYGIPHTAVGAGQARVPVTFQYADESDPGPYPIPADAPVEGSGSGDSHVLVVDASDCTLYELYAARRNADGSWRAGSGARWPLDSNRLRPDRWTSADAAGLPILPGLARCDEASSGHVDHALRFTVAHTQRAYIYPASHYAASDTAADAPPMGLRLRLKAGYDISALDGQARAIAEALKAYGMILADNGSNWYISGETNPSCWNDDDLDRLKKIPGTAFEVVQSPPPPSDVPGDLLANGGFEAGRVRGSRPGAWSVRHHGVRACDDPAAGRQVADAGQCALRLVGADGVTSRVSQVLTRVPAGALHLQLRARPIAVPPRGARVVVTLEYADGSRATVHRLLPYGSNGGYTLFALELVPTQPVRQLSVSLVYAAASGRMLIDQAALTAGP